MSSQNDFQYIEAKAFQNLPVVEISDVKSFVRFANSNNIQYIFKINRDNGTDFFFTNNAIAYKLDSRNFHTLLDMQLAENGGFTDANEYEEARKLKISTKAELAEFKQGGNYNKEEYDAAVKAGFKEHFEKFRSNYGHYQKGEHTAAIPDDVDTFVKLYKYALQKSISNYKDFKKIYNAGFADSLSFNDAEEKGFKDARSYFDAKRRGFDDAEEYHVAEKLKIEFKKEYDEYDILTQESSPRNMTFDQYQLLVAFSNCSNGQIISIAEARKLLQNEQEKSKKSAGIEDKQYLPAWYKKGIAQDAQLKEFMKTNTALRMFGFFNTEKKSFEVFKLSAQKIVVDGSNVAYNAKAVPDIKNIRAVVKELQFYKFTDILVLVDASLPYFLKHPAMLEELKKDFNCHEAPSKSSADEFLISAAKKGKCKIVTNDEFRDWKKRDKWVFDKIDDLCVKFRVVEEGVAILRDIGKFIEKPVNSLSN